MAGYKSLAYVVVMLALVSGSIAGLGSDGLQVLSGQWDVDSQRNVYSIENKQRALAILEEDFNLGDSVIGTTLHIRDWESQNGFIIFDFVDKTNFKYAGARAKDDIIVIGQYEYGEFKDSTSLHYEIDPNTDYELRLILEGSDATIQIEDASLIKNFPLTFNQVIGFAVHNSDTIFKGVSINSSEATHYPRFANINEVAATTGTGLDEIIEIIKNDPGLNKNIPQTDLLEGMYHSNRMNEIILRTILETGVANDDRLSVLDMKILDDHIYRHYFTSWKRHHGDDENGYEYGFHLIQNDGATTQIYGQNAVNTVFDGFYHLGFGAANDFKIYNEDYNRNQKYSDLGMWLSGFLQDELRQRKLRNEIGSNYRHSLREGESLAFDNTIYLGDSNDNAIIVFEDKYDIEDLTINLDFELTKMEDSKNGFVVFDYGNSNNFKYAGVSPDSKSWVIGEYKSGEWKHLASKKDIILADQPYELQIRINKGKVVLNVNQYDVVTHEFRDRINDDIGIGTHTAVSIFSDIEFIGNQKKGILSSILSFFTNT